MLLLALSVACGGSRAARREDSSATASTSPPAETRRDEARFANTPLTTVASSLTELLETTLAGRTTSALIGVLEPSIAGSELRAAHAPSSVLEPIAFLSRVHVRLAGPEPARELVLGFLLSRSGLRIVQFELRWMGEPAGGPVVRARGADEVATALLTRLRASSDLELAELSGIALLPEAFPAHVLPALAPIDPEELRAVLAASTVAEVSLGDLALFFEDAERKKHVADFRPEPSRDGTLRLAIELTPVDD